MIADWFKRNWSHSTYYTSWPALRRTLQRLEASGAPAGLDSLVPRVNAPASRQRAFSPADLAALLDAPQPAWLRCLVLLCHDCAFRARTALSVSSNEYDAKARVLRTRTKQGRAVAVPVSARLAELLAIAPLDGTPFIAGLAGVPSISYASARGHFVALCRDTGLSPGYKLHDLRRTIARTMWRANRNLQQVQSLLGHSSLNTTLYYLASDVLSVDAEALSAFTGGGYGE